MQIKQPDQLEIVSKTSSILMSDVLKDQIPELDQDVSEFADKIVSVVIELQAGDEQEAMIGTLVSVSSGENPVSRHDKGKKKC